MHARIKTYLAALALSAATSGSFCYSSEGGFDPERSLLLLPLIGNGVTWTNLQVVIAPNQLPPYDTADVSGPTVLRDGNLFKIWYAASDGGGVERILYAESIDGIHWSNFQLAVNVGASGSGFDTLRVYSPMVIKEASIYRLWYSASNGTSRTLYAESSDGLNWSGFTVALAPGISGQGFDTMHAFSPMVVDRYTMYYSGVVMESYQVYRRGRCSSSDGRVWSNCTLNLDIGTQGALDTHNIGRQAVFHDSTRYKTWYSGSSTAFNYDIIYCESLDGLHWGACQPAIVRGSLPPYDSNSVNGPTVLADGGIGKMWYTAADGATAHIVYAESR